MKNLKNFSPHTIKRCWRVFNRWLKIGQIPNEENLSKFVIDRREAGLNTTNCNISIITFNSFLTWMKDKGICPKEFSNGKPFKIAKLPEDKRQFETFDDPDIHKMKTSISPALLKLKARFETWRSTRASIRTRTPEHLRQAALALLDQHPASLICRVCRIHPRTLQAPRVPQKRPNRCRRSSRCRHYRPHHKA